MSRSVVPVTFTVKFKVSSSHDLCTVIHEEGELKRIVLKDIIHSGMSRSCPVQGKKEKNKGGETTRKYCKKSILDNTELHKRSRQSSTILKWNFALLLWNCHLQNERLSKVYLRMTREEYLRILM